MQKNANSVRLAMWSGPRNISTAMMRAWENRSDTAVWDEPLYAYYLRASGEQHPLREEVLAAGDDNWRRVTARCSGNEELSVPIFYQKHMTHHVLPEVGYDWLDGLQHCFLIRDPTRVVQSYLLKREAVALADIGIERQWQLFDELCQRRGNPPLVIDSADFLRNPESYLKVICAYIGVGFEPSMLAWPAGPRASDGVWAPHWYHAVQASTGFQAPPARAVEALLDHPVAEAANRYYQQLWAQRSVLS